MDESILNVDGGSDNFKCIIFNEIDIIHFGPKNNYFIKRFIFM